MRFYIANNTGPLKLSRDNSVQDGLELLIVFVSYLMESCFVVAGSKLRSVLVLSDASLFPMIVFLMLRVLLFDSCIGYYEIFR